jgi:hypothetical protein
LTTEVVSCISSLPPNTENILNDLLVLIEKHGTNPHPHSVLFEPTEEKIYYNAWSDFWRYVIGVNVIPADTRAKKTHIKWSGYQNNPISEEQHNQWKMEGAFLKGMAVIAGKVWHRSDKDGQYFTIIDLDNAKGIEELCTRFGKTVSLDIMAQKFLVEQHKDNLEKAHVCFYSQIPFPQKSSDSISGIEVKGVGEHGIMYCSCSIHQNKNPEDEGEYRYEIIGVPAAPITLSMKLADEMIQHINRIYIRYGIEYLEKDRRISKLRPMIKTLKLDPTIEIFEGDRHITLLSAADSLLLTHLGKVEEEQLKKFFVEINKQLCKPTPLSDDEIESIWRSAIEFARKIREREEVGQPQKEQQESGSSAVPPKSSAETLIELANEKIRVLFKDQYGTAYALVNNADHNETVRVESSKFKRYLAKLYYDNRNKLANSEAITNTIQVLQATAEYDGQTIPLSLRVVWYNGDIYYDMTDEKGQCIKISEESCELVSSTPIPLFTRFNQKPQVLPDKNYLSTIFDDFLDLMHIHDPNQRLLTKVWTTALLIPDIPHPINITFGEQGGSKSTFCRFIKRLVDPDRIELLTIPRHKEEFVQQLYHNHLAVCENVKYLPRYFSDEVCKAITGVGNSKRGLYTNDEDIIYNYKRCIIINGINNSLTEPDALDRSILTQFDRIPDEQRREESEVDAKFEEMRPKLFGYVLDILVKALQIKPTIELRNLPRMADFATWGEAIAKAMGYKPMEFLNAYYDNIGKQNAEAIESNPLAHAIEKFVDTRCGQGEEACWQSPTSKALEELNLVARRYDIDTSSTSWPKAVNSLTMRLRPILSNLREGLGIHINISRNTTGKNKNTSTIRIWKEPPPSPPSPPIENHAHKKQKLVEVL